MGCRLAVASLSRVEDEIVDTRTQSATMTAAAPDLSVAYLALLGMLIVPQFMLIHPYLHLLIVAPLLVWTGSQRALVEASKAPEESQARPAPRAAPPPPPHCTAR